MNEDQPTPAPVSPQPPAPQNSAVPATTTPVFVPLPNLPNLPDSILITAANSNTDHRQLITEDSKGGDK